MCVTPFDLSLSFQKKETQAQHANCLTHNVTGLIRELGYEPVSLLELTLFARSLTDCYLPEQKISRYLL